MNPGTIGHVLTSDAYGVGTWQPPAAGGDSDWTIDGNNVYHETGYVGIGIGFSERPLDVVGDTGPCARFRNVASGDDFAVDARNDGGTAGAFFAGPSGVVYPAVPAALYGNGAAGYRGAHLYSEDDYALFALSGSNRAIYASTSGGYCAYFAGGEVEVDERLKVGEFEMSPGTAGYVLTSDASGVGTWQPASSTADGDWTIAGNDMYSGVSGRVGAGANAPTAKFHVYTGADEQGLRVVHDIGASGQTASIERAQIPNAGNDILQLKVPTGSGSGFQFIECENGSTVAFAVNGDGAVTSQGGGSFSSDYLDENVPVLGGVFSGSGSADVAGVYGESTPGPGVGIGGEFVGGRWGVKAIALAEGTGEHYGLYAAAHGVPGANFGVVGYVESGISRYGVYGGCVGSGYAGFFAGDVHASGTLTAGTKSFKIDHPLDPENKYLMHSSVESDEMMNIYNGNVALDAGGEAWVEMPDWFEVLNEDFRYQLTAIGAPGPNLHIAERIADGRFKIAGGEAGMDVSWMVTGVRHDPVAAASPLSVEVDKPPHEAGKYLNPEAYDKPASLGVGHIATPDAAEKRVSRPSDTGDANDGE